MKSYIITIRGPERFISFVGLYRSSFDATLSSLDVAQLGERVSVKLVEAA